MQRTMENNLRKCIILGEMQCNCVHVILFRITELTSVQMAIFTMKSKTNEERKKQNKTKQHCHSEHPQFVGLLQ